MDESEKSGGAPFDSSRGLVFANWIHECNLIDVVADGPKFTWVGPKIGNCNRVFERLDRLLYNQSWRVGFEEATVSVIAGVIPQ